MPVMASRWRVVRPLRLQPCGRHDLFGSTDLADASAGPPMGGDALMLAQIITLQTILAAVTMPIAIALVA